MPWHANPTRIAEKIAVLQLILGDRFLLGFGRGLARERFDQAAEIMLDLATVSRNLARQLLA